ncbi:DUF397 domain-containing protein [Streptomyces sp. NPDC006290]|uniref:DUF397 domain-containing protein n=1 Tax=Streptomyces sp. NPDC006290 TaxID=3156745 RepID=UPI0033B3CC77
MRLAKRVRSREACNFSREPRVGRARAARVRFRRRACCQGGRHVGVREGTALAEALEETWRRSSRSGADSGQCCEVALLADGVLVRDSKQPEGPVLSFRSDAWRTAVALLFTRGDAERTT